MGEVDLSPPTQDEIYGIPTTTYRDCVFAKGNVENHGIHD